MNENEIMSRKGYCALTYIPGVMQGVRRTLFFVVSEICQACSPENM